MGIQEVRKKKRDPRATTDQRQVGGNDPFLKLLSGMENE